MTNRTACVRHTLQGYVDRGVFRSFSGDRAEFRFNWLWGLPFRLTFDARRGALAFKKLLPKISAEMAAGLKDFIAGCCSAERPEYRRLDTTRVAIRYVNRASGVSLTFVVLDGDYEYAAKQAINLVNEIFLSFVNVQYPEYMVENFGLPEE